MQWLSQTAFIDTTVIMTKLLSKHTLTLSFISSNHSWAFSQYGLFETSHQDIYTTICELWKQDSDQVNIQFFKSILKVGVRTETQVCPIYTGEIDIHIRTPKMKVDKTNNKHVKILWPLNLQACMTSKEKKEVTNFCFKSFVSSITFVSGWIIKIYCRNVWHSPTLLHPAPPHIPPLLHYGEDTVCRQQSIK